MIIDKFERSPITDQTLIRSYPTIIDKKLSISPSIEDCLHATSRNDPYEPEVLSVSDSDSVLDTLSDIDAVSDEPPTLLDWIPERLI